MDSVGCMPKPPFARKLANGSGGVSYGVVKVGEGPAKEASRRGAVHLIHKLRETERLLQGKVSKGGESESKRPKVPFSSRPRFSLLFLHQLLLSSTHQTTN